MILSVLVCTMKKRALMFKSLVDILNDQSKGRVEILSDDSTDPTGTKRNRLIQRATGEYVVFVDDDDMISHDYINSILEATSYRPDVVGFKGWMLTNGKNRTEWIISNSLPYETALINKKTVYLRYSNHLSPIKRDIAIQIGYPDITIQEDYQYATKLRESGLLKTEVFIDKHLYTYQFITKK